MILFGMQDIARQVKRNCDISDAKSWGFYSICGLLLRLRELYLSEHGLPPWEKIEHGLITSWIGKKEALWKALSGEDYAEIEIEGVRFPPFGAALINKALAARKLLYGAGYGPHMKATFFLADLVRRERVDGLDVFIAGREYARDLSNAVAMLKGDVVVARLDAARHLIWQKYEEYRTKKRSHTGAATFTTQTLALAFETYGIGPEEPEAEMVLERTALPELETYIRHEIGEASEGKRLGPAWAELIMSSAEPKTNLFLRAVKDVLADTTEKGMLRYITGERRAGSLAFYILFLAGYRRLLSRPMEEAFREFLSTRNWDLLGPAASTVYKKATEISSAILELRKAGQSIGPFVEETLGGLK